MKTAIIGCGAIAPAHIEALLKKGFEVDRKVIIIKESVKEVGNYKATLKLHKEISVEIPFEVISE